jgi:hypothetical protein
MAANKTYVAVIRIIHVWVNASLIMGGVSNMDPYREIRQTSNMSQKCAGSDGLPPMALDISISRKLGLHECKT